jgi:hypothetical protein
VLCVSGAELLRLRVEAGQLARDVREDRRCGCGGEQCEGSETGVKVGCELAGLLAAGEFGGDPLHQLGPGGGGRVAG